jgi:alpha-beta hydrolase superfamily lysophospholipase
LVLCPGLDGSGNLFGPLQAEADARGVPVEIVRYPSRGACRTVDDYVAIVRTHRARFVGTPHLLVAESFSGPLAIRAAAADPPAGLVLVATFRRRPRRWPAWLLGAAGPVLRQLPPPRWAIRAFLTGPADPALLDTLQREMASARHQVASRLRLVADHDAGSAYRDVDAPILLLDGAHDRIVTAADTEDLRTLRPDATSRTLDAAHLVLQTAPQRALDAIEAWWRPERSRS